MKNFLYSVLVEISIPSSLKTIPNFAQQIIPVGFGDGDRNTALTDKLTALPFLGGVFAIQKLRRKRHETEPIQYFNKFFNSNINQPTTGAVLQNEIKRLVESTSRVASTLVTQKIEPAFEMDPIYNLKSK